LLPDEVIIRTLQLRHLMSSARLYVGDLCHLVDGSAQALMRGVPSCEKPRVSTRSFRTGDALMRTLDIFMSIRKDRERSELKHLSRSRRRNQLRCRE
jgi:hypothetical protein